MSEPSDLDKALQLLEQTNQTIENINQIDLNFVQYHQNQIEPEAQQIEPEAKQIEQEAKEKCLKFEMSYMEDLPETLKDAIRKKNWGDGNDDILVLKGNEKEILKALRNSKKTVVREDNMHILQNVPYDKPLLDVIKPYNNQNKKIRMIYNLKFDGCSWGDKVIELVFFSAFKMKFIHVMIILNHMCYCGKTHCFIVNMIMQRVKLRQRNASYNTWYGSKPVYDVNGGTIDIKWYRPMLLFVSICGIRAFKVGLGKIGLHWNDSELTDYEQKYADDNQLLNGKYYSGYISMGLNLQAPVANKNDQKKKKLKSQKQNRRIHQTKVHKKKKNDMITGAKSSECLRCKVQGKAFCIMEEDITTLVGTKYGLEVVATFWGCFRYMTALHWVTKDGFHIGSKFENEDGVSGNIIKDKEADRYLFNYKYGSLTESLRSVKRAYDDVKYTDITDPSKRSFEWFKKYGLVDTCFTEFSKKI